MGESNCDGRVGPGWRLVRRTMAPSPWPLDSFEVCELRAHEVFDLLCKGFPLGFVRHARPLDLPCCRTMGASFSQNDKLVGSLNEGNPHTDPGPVWSFHVVLELQESLHGCMYYDT